MQRTFLAAVAAALAASAALAQQPPNTADEEAAPEDEIVVLANPEDQVRIDRRTYVVRNDPAAQATNMFDVLGRIPSVSVAPSGAVTLLGASGVAIQINGQPVPSENLEQVLRGLNGADVERIEVITNPSAEFSAQSSGGIINIITRQRYGVGLNGSVQLGGDTEGAANGGVSINWSGGPWTLSLQAGLNHSEGDGTLDRVRETLAGDPLVIEDGAFVQRFDGAFLNRLSGAYRFDERRRMNLTVGGGGGESESARTTLMSGANGPLSTRVLAATAVFDFRYAAFEFQADGDQPREQLKLNAHFNGFDNEWTSRSSEIPTGADPFTEFATLADTRNDNGSMRLDIVSPLGGERMLSWGAAFDASEQAFRNALQALAGDAPLPYDARLDGRQETAALYATYQFAIGRWTWLPGMRVENYRREVISAGLESDTVDFRAFPTVHVRRSIGESLTLDVSYTSRIARPDLRQLDPAPRFVDADRAIVGNPDLAPTTTDAYEANLTYQRRSTSFGVTFYDRVSDDIVSSFTEQTAEGTILTRPVNAGTSEQRGLQIMLRGPLWEGLRYSLTANALNRAFDAIQAGALVRRSEFEYDGVAQLEFRDEDQAVAGADHVQLELRFQGPRFGLQSESDEFVTLNATWRRRLTRSIFAVLAAQDILDTAYQQSLTVTEDYIERTEFRGQGPRLRLSLTYQFGAGGERTMQEQPQGPNAAPQ